MAKVAEGVIAFDVAAVVRVDADISSGFDYIRLSDLLISDFLIS